MNNQMMVDESVEDPIFALGGFIAEAWKWKKFSEEWQKVLDAYPSIEYLKMREAASGTGCFSSLDKKQTADKLIDLGRIINSCARHGVVCAVHTEAYKNAFYKRASQTLDSPYYYLATRLISRVITIQREYARTPLGWLDKKIDFIFDDYSQKDEILYHWDMLKRSKHSGHLMAPIWATRRLGSPPVWRDEKNFLPIQAADMIVWLIRKALIESLRGGDLSPSVPVPGNGNGTALLVRSDSKIDEIAPKLREMMKTKVFVDIVPADELLFRGNLLSEEGLGKPYETGKMRSERLKVWKNSKQSP